MRMFQLSKKNPNKYDYRELKVYLPFELAQALKLEAGVRGLSEGEVVKRLIAGWLTAPRKTVESAVE
jgi:hypothetical protein